MPSDKFSPLFLEIRGFFSFLDYRHLRQFFFPSLTGNSLSVINRHENDLYEVNMQNRQRKNRRRRRSSFRGE